MNTWQIILGIASLAIAATILNYCNKTRKKEGPIYSTAYLALSDEEKEFFDKDKEYERITILYGIIGIFFIFIALCIFTLIKIFAYAALSCIAVALIYSIIKLIEARKNYKK